MPDQPRNRLADATSPYLLQHKGNPVHWYEWGESAFRQARAEDRPILLSVGYASCHWCHVMAHESFEDPETAEMMNRLFVNVKVDREERPDVDRVYMDAVQAMTGRGGWPMTVFLTPDGRPFFAGTYFPIDDRLGMPSFKQVMAAVHEAWAERRHDVEEQAGKLTRAVQQQLPAAGDSPGQEELAGAYRALGSSFDPRFGGFGGAPKFPQAPTLEFLLRAAGMPWAPEALPMLGQTLELMARGGIYDQLGGGFTRYSVDERWLIPHFEKMLYDNALLARVYLRAWQLTGRDRLRRVAVETLDYMLRDLLLPGGGFASGEDADSEGVEGKFYVWDHDEFVEVVGAEDARLAGRALGVTPEGNFEGNNILHEALTFEQVAATLDVRAADVEAAASKAKERLLQVRATRVRPGLDDKAVCAWNGLALRALAEAGAVLGEERYLEAARRNARFLLGEMRRNDGRLLRAWRGGKASVPAFCDDYAASAVGLFALYQATGELEWYTAARRLTEEVVELFADPDGDGFFATGHDAEELIARPKNVMDNPTPSDNALAAEALLHLAHYTGDPEASKQMEGIFRMGGRLLGSYPTAAGQLLAVLLTSLAPPREVAVVGAPDDPATEALVDVVWEKFRPECLLATDPGDGSAAAEIPLLEGRAPHDGPPLAHVCFDFVCEAPTGDPEELRRQLSPVVEAREE